MLNLLIRENRYEIRGEYLNRVFNVFLIATVVILISFVAMKYSMYMYVSSEHSVYLDKKNNIEKALISTEQGDYDKKLIHLEKEYILFNSFKNSPSEYFSKILENRPESISINDTQVSYIDQDIEIRVGGVSANRNALIEFSDSLKKVQEFESVNVPFSSFVKDVNIPFILNVKVKKE